MAPSKKQVANAYKAANALGIRKEDIKPVLQDLYKAFDKNWEHIEADNYRVLIDTYFDLKENKGEEEKRAQRPGERPHLAEEEDGASSSDDGNDLSPRHVASGDGTTHTEWASASAVSHSNHKNDFMNPKDKVSTDDATVSAESTSMRRPGPMNRAARTQRHKADSNSATITLEDKQPAKYITDITKSTERLAISLVDEVGNESLPKFNYIPQNIIYENANLNISLSRIADEDCCADCSGDCLSSPLPCACAHETGGEFVYTPEGLNMLDRE